MTYTPTTTEVKVNYALVTGSEARERKAEFDRWLDEVRAEVWDEGYATGLEDCDEACQCCKSLGNPYRSP